MNITKVVVDDPRSRGVWEDPIVTLTVDEPIYEQGDPVFNYGRSLQYRYIPCGPFYAVEYRPDRGMSYDKWVNVADNKHASLGEVNPTGLLPEQIMPVKVEYDLEVFDLAMTVSRVRRLLRRHDIEDWHVIVSAERALAGFLEWRVELVAPVCYGGARPRSAACTRTPTTTLIHKDTHLSLCPEHLAKHQSRMRSSRISS